METFKIEAILAAVEYKSLSRAAEEFSYVTLQRGYGINTVHYNLSDPEIKEFCTILNSISAEDCKLEKRYNDRKDDTIAMYRNGEYWVFQLLEEPQIYVLLDTEQAPEYGANGSGKHVIIESPELWNYVVNMLENALK